MVWVSDEEAVGAWDEDGFLCFKALRFHPDPRGLSIIHLQGEVMLSIGAILCALQNVNLLSAK